MTVRVNQGRFSVNRSIAFATDAASGNDFGSRMLVTPEIATKWLESAMGNRHISQDRVKMYAEDMKSGNWMLTNQGIGFARDGRLLDGQHRLWAIIESGVSVEMLVVHDLDPLAQDAVDQLRTRTSADQLALHGVTGAAALVSRVRILERIRSGPKNLIISYNRVRQLIEEWKEPLEWSLEHFPARTGLSQASAVAAWIYARGVDRSIESAVAGYLDGAGLVIGDPILKLREAYVWRAGRVGTGGVGQTEVLLRTLRALQCWVVGSKPQRLFGTAEGLLYFAKRAGDKRAREAWSDYTLYPR